MLDSAGGRVRASTHVRREPHGERMGVVGGVVVLADAPPRGGVEVRKARVPRDVRFDVRELEPGGQRQEGSVDVAAPDDADLGGARQQSTGRFDAPDHFDALEAARRAREHDVSTLRKRSTDRSEGLAAHHDGLRERQPPETSEIVGQAPGQRTVGTDDTVPCDRGDEDDLQKLDLDALGERLEAAIKTLKDLTTGGGK